MTLTKEDFKDIADGDWLHVEYLEGAQASGVVKRVEELHLKIDLGGGIGAVVFHTIGELTTVHVSRIIEHRPVKRTPKVGDVINHDEWNRYDWPTEGSTWLTSAAGTFLRSVGGDFPQIYNGAYADGLYRFTVVQLPTPASDPAPRILHTVEEVDELPFGSIVVDAEGDVMLRKALGYDDDWRMAGESDGISSRALDLPVTVLREGGATS